MKIVAMTIFTTIVLTLSACGDENTEYFAPVHDYTPHSTLDQRLNCVVDESTPVATINMYDEVMGDGYCAFGYNVVGWPVCRRVNKQNDCWYETKPYPGDVGLVALCPSSVSTQQDCVAAAGKVLSMPVN